MLRPHADVLWEFSDFALGASLAKVKFPSGQIDSTQWGVVLSTGTEFKFVPAARLDVPVSANGRSGVGFDKLEALVGTYRTRSGRTLLDGGAGPANLLLSARAPSRPSGTARSGGLKRAALQARVSRGMRNIWRRSLSKERCWGIGSALAPGSPSASVGAGAWRWAEARSPSWPPTAPSI